jgi:hypothetical protein
MLKFTLLDRVTGPNQIGHLLLKSSALVPEAAAVVVILPRLQLLYLAVALVEELRVHIEFIVLLT